MRHNTSAILKRICLMFFAFYVFTGTSVNAELHVIQAGLDIYGEYSDNIAFEKTDPRDDIYINAEPSLEYKYLTEQFTFNSKASYNLIRYSEESDLDRENQDYSLRWQYKSERLTLLGNVSYRLDTTQGAELIETGEITTRQDRERYFGRARLDWRLSELSQISFDYNYLMKEFENQNSVDYDRHSISLGFSRYLNNGLDSISVIPLYEYRDSDSSELDNYSVSLGWRHEFSETFFIKVSAGGRYTEQEFADGSTEENSGIVANMGIGYKTETANVEFSYSRNLLSNVGGGETEVDQFFLNLNRRVYRRLGIGLSGRLYLRRKPGGSSSRERTFSQVSPTISYRLTEKQSLVLGYRYSNSYDKYSEEEVGTDIRMEKSDTVDQNSVWLVLNLKFDNK